jgi:hypothetical protein
VVFGAFLIDSQPIFKACAFDMRFNLLPLQVALQVIFFKPDLSRFILMKKSSSVLLSAFFIAFVSSCRSGKEWVNGADTYDIQDGDTLQYQRPDTVIGGTTYRFYIDNWYRVYNNRIHVPRRLMEQGHRAVVEHTGARRSTDIPTGKTVVSTQRRGGFGSIALKGSAHT